MKERTKKTRFWICLFLMAGISGLWAQEWQPDYATALAKASDTGRPLILVFSGSDWCAPCIKLDREVWQSEAFIAYAKEHYVMYRADFPRKKANKLPEAQARANGELAEKFNPQGYFPLVVVLNGQEKTLGKTGYEKGGAENYIALLNGFLP